MTGTQDIGNFTGEPAVTITGTVADASRNPVQNVKVFAHSTADPPEPLGGDPDGTDASGGFEFDVPADVDFEIEIMEAPGLVYGHPPANINGVSSWTSPAAGSPTMNIGTFQGTAGVTVTGTVQNPDGSAASGVRVLAIDTATQDVDLGFDPETDSSGQFELTLPPSTAFVLEIMANNMAFDIPAANTNQVSSWNTPSTGTLNTGTFQGVEAAQVIGTVQDGNNAPVGGVEVIVWSTETPARELGFADTNDQGGFMTPVALNTQFTLEILSDNLNYAKPAENTTGTSAWTTPATVPALPLETGIFKPALRRVPRSLREREFPSAPSICICAARRSRSTCPGNPASRAF